MTDKEKWVALLEEMDVGFEDLPARDGGCGLEIREGMKNVKGYCFFLTTLEFDKDGKFESIGAWE